MELSGKLILLISPQAWDSQFVSKHHYAIELAKKGNRVLFLGPPEKKGLIDIKPTEYKDVFVVNYSLWFNRKLRFHIRWLFDILIRLHVREIIKKIGEVELVWCFEPNLYKNLDWFNSKYKIFHPVDNVQDQTQINVGESADVIFAVAKNILDQFQKIKTPSFLINHGLSDSFVQDFVKDKDSKIRIAYIGNLMIRGLDRKSIKEVVQMHPEVVFDFYGSYSDDSTDSFITFLKDQDNSYLKGTKTTTELAEVLKLYSGFLICYNPVLEMNSGSNSHKILEYLSFGKVIIANKIYHYEEHRDLIQMSSKYDNSDFVELFQETIINIKQYNTEELFKNRRMLAFENTYSKQIDRIENYMNQVLA